MSDVTNFSDALTVLEGLRIDATAYTQPDVKEELSRAAQCLSWALDELAQEREEHDKTRRALDIAVELAYGEDVTE